MGEFGGDQGVVEVVWRGHRTHGQCSCGWIGRQRVFLSWARVDALLHAARGECVPDCPLVQLEVTSLGSASYPSGSLRGRWGWS
jgi:hypothetical protein